MIYDIDILIKFCKKRFQNRNDNIIPQSLIALDEYLRAYFYDLNQLLSFYK